MNLINLVLYQSCNQSCKHCPMKQWIYAPNAVDANGNKLNALTNEIILNWYDKYIDPNICLTQINGGEPALYPEINTLIPALTKRGHKGIVLTNGSLYVPQSDNFKRCAAWHMGYDMPKYYDLILILKNPYEDWQKKVEHCKQNNIMYEVFEFQYFNDENAPALREIDPYINPEYIDYVSTIYASGTMAGCPSAAVIEGKSILKMSEPEMYPIKEKCPHCQTVRAFEVFCKRFNIL